MKVLNFGSMNLDYVYQVEHFVVPGETMSAIGQQVNCGGKGLNQSVALAKAGVEVYHAGCVGQGGDMLLDMLREFHVHTEYINKVDTIQGNAMIQVDKNGQNCILIYGGSNQCITKDQIEETLSVFSKEDYLILQNEVNELPELVNLAYKKGMKIVLNPSPYDSKLEHVDFSKLTWLILNEVEAEQISGSNNTERIWNILHEKYPKLSVVLTLGEEGSICYSGDTVIRQPATEAVAVDTTAAGDTFTGFFLSGLIENLSLKECMERASVAAAISVTRHGAAGSIPTRDEVLKRQGKNNVIRM